jgi:hypothetical protein
MDEPKLADRGCPKDSPESARELGNAAAAEDHALIVGYVGEREPLEVSDHALDMHMARGRRRGRGAEHFLAEGAQLANEADVDDPYVDEAARDPEQPAAAEAVAGQLALDDD